MAAQLAAPPAAVAGSAATLPPLVAELEQTPTSFLEPAAFFVSWQGVLTLAYRRVLHAVLVAVLLLRCELLVAG